MPIITDEMYSRITRKDKLGKYAQNIPLQVGSVIMTDRDMDISVPGLLATDIVIASVAKKDATAVTAVESAAYQAADNLRIRATAAVGTGDGVVNYAIFRFTA